MAQKIVLLALIMFIMAIVGCVSAQDGAKTAPATEGGKKSSTASATPPAKAAAGPVPEEGADPAALSPSDAGNDAADGPIGETTTEPDVVPMAPTSSVIGADGPAGAVGGKSGAAVLKVPAAVVGVASGFFFFFCSGSFF